MRNAAFASERFPSTISTDTCHLAVAAGTEFASFFCKTAYIISSLIVNVCGETAAGLLLEY
jgi:hypothetical protein